jgi:large subunit ribosomal protein L30
MSETQSEPQPEPVKSETPAAPATPTEKPAKSASTKLAVILVRGVVGVPKTVKDTLAMLRLSRKNRCFILESNEVYLGMLRKVKDYVTWGPITDQTFQELLSKRGQPFQSRESDSKGKYNYKFLEVSGKKYKPYFNLSPPRKGFGRKGIKAPFNVGGALGPRGDKINDLILRML